MSRSHFRDGQPPWSFFIPVTLAVVLGVLIADAIKLAIGTVFVTQLAVERNTRSAPASATAAPVQQAPAANQPAAAPRQLREVERTVELVQLPGPSTARNNGDERACINGTIALRVGNGWEQVIGTDSAPARCEAISR